MTYGPCPFQHTRRTGSPVCRSVTAVAGEPAHHHSSLVGDVGPISRRFYSLGVDEDGPTFCHQSLDDGGSLATHTSHSGTRQWRWRNGSGRPARLPCPNHRKQRPARVYRPHSLGGGGGGGGSAVPSARLCIARPACLSSANISRI